MPNTSSWEQLPDEKAHIYEAARVYFELGPRRTLREVARHCHRSPRTIAHWSGRFRWAERARAYDAYRLKLEDAERQKVLEHAARTEAQKWFERLREEREEEWRSAQALLAKAREMLACPLEDTKWNWRDAGVLIDQAAKLVRMAAGEPEDADDETSERGRLTVRVEYREPNGGSDADEVQQASEDETP